MKKKSNEIVEQAVAEETTTQAEVQENDAITTPEETKHHRTVSRRFSARIAVMKKVTGLMKALKTALISFAIRNADENGCITEADEAFINEILTEAAKKAGQKIEEQQLMAAIDGMTPEQIQRLRDIINNR